MDEEAELTENERAQFRALAWRWFTTARKIVEPDVAEAVATEELDAVDLLDAAGVGADDSERGPVSGAVPATASTEVTRRHLKGLLEALVFASDKPMPEAELAKQATADKKLVKELLQELVVEYEGRGFRMMEVASGWALRTAPIYAPFVRDLAAKKPIRMSRAQTETLAIVAYRQPVTRPEVDDVRGVDSGAALKALLERELVRVLGKRDEPGRPLIYGTTASFLEFFGLKSLADLPTLREFTELSDESKRIFEREMGEDAPEDLAAVHESFAGGEGRVEGEITPPEAQKRDEDEGESDDDDDESDDDDDDDESGDDESEDDESGDEAVEAEEVQPSEKADLAGEAPPEASDDVAAEESDEDKSADDDDEDESDDDDDESEDDDDDDDDESDDDDDDDDESDDDDDDESDDDDDDESDVAGAASESDVAVEPADDGSSTDADAPEAADEMTPAADEPPAGAVDDDDDDDDDEDDEDDEDEDDEDDKPEEPAK